GERPSVDTDDPDLRLNLAVRKGGAILSVDLGGGSLHRRGWRVAQGEAPLKETLAAAVLLRGNWPQVHAAGGGLLDPMCGSGTLRPGPPSARPAWGASAAPRPACPRAGLASTPACGIGCWWRRAHATAARSCVPCSSAATATWMQCARQSPMPMRPDMPS